MLSFLFKALGWKEIVIYVIGGIGVGLAIAVLLLAVFSFSSNELLLHFMLWVVGGALAGAVFRLTLAALGDESSRLKSHGEI